MHEGYGAGLALKAAELQDTLSATICYPPTFGRPKNIDPPPLNFS